MSHETAAVLPDDVFWALMVRFLGDGGGGDARLLATPPLRRTCVCAGVAQRYHLLKLRVMAKQARQQLRAAGGFRFVL